MAGMEVNGMKPMTGEWLISRIERDLAEMQDEDLLEYVEILNSRRR